MKFFSLICCQFVLMISVQAQIARSKDSLVSITVNDSTFVKVEVESTFPGGVPGWINFLNKNLVYPPKAERQNIQGTVVLQFIVDKDGSLYDIEAISGPDLLKEAALKVIRKSPRWQPAMQSGKKVKSYKKQPIVFKLS